MLIIIALSKVRLHHNLQTASALPTQLKIGRILLAAGGALHVAGSGRGVFVGVDDLSGAIVVVVAGDPDLGAGVVNRYFPGHALRVLIKNFRRNIGVFEQIQYYLRFHQIAGGIHFFHAVMSFQRINRLSDKNYVV